MFAAIAIADLTYTGKYNVACQAKWRAREGSIR